MGDQSEEQEQGERGGLGTAQGWAFGFGAGAVVLVLLVFAFMIGYNSGQEEGGGEPAAEQSQPEEAGAPAPGGPGEELFVESCGSCHTLSAAGTSGTTGPDLDGLAPDEQQVEAAIENGGTGSGAMPANLLQGTAAQAVAEYVAATAGK